MSIINLDKISLKNFPTYVKISAFILALTLPGFGFLFVTNPALILSATPPEFFFMIVLYSLPLYFLWFIEESIKDKHKNRIPIALNAATMTLLYFYTFLLMYHINDIFGYLTIKAEYFFYGLALIWFLLDIIELKLEKKK